MKRVIFPLALLLTLFATAPLLAVDSSQRPTLVQDVIRMAQGGVSDQAIIAFVQNRRGTYTVTADDMIAMSDAKVSPEVVKFVADGAATDDQNWRDRQAAEREERAAQDREPRTVTRVYVSPWWDPWWYYDPFWYGPRLSVGIGLGWWGGYRGPFWGGHYGGFHGRPIGHPGGGGRIHRGR